jgi:fructose-specific phosphotransferase system IIC component
VPSTYAPIRGFAVTAGDRVVTTTAYAGDVQGLLSWWDGVELWLSGLGFVLQTVIVIPVVLLLAYAIALVIDVILGNGIRVLRRLRGADRRLR